MSNSICPDTLNKNIHLNNFPRKKAISKNQKRNISADIVLLETLCGIQTSTNLRTGPVDFASIDVKKLDMETIGKIGEIQHILGDEYGDGFLLAGLTHYQGDVGKLIDAIFSAELPVALQALDQSMDLEGLSKGIT
jgi:hypothetical protein